MTRTVRRKLMVIGATLFLLFGAAMVKAQNFPVRASVTIVNPSPYLEDYGRDGNTIIILTLVDNRPSYQGLLRLSVIGQNFEATTNEATFLSRPITLLRGVPLILRGPEIAPYFDLNNLDVEGLIIDNTLRNGGRIPDGPLTITAEFFDINRFDAPAVSNLGLATRFVQQNYPPELVAPLGEIPDQPTPVINFSWNPRHIPQPANDEYVLQVWEKVPGLTDDQIANSRGFQRRPIITRIPRYTYTNTDSRMEVGKSYLWRVQVRDQRNVRRFVNNGYSTYGTFVYGLDDDPDDCKGPIGLVVAGIGENEAGLSWSFPTGVAQEALTISTRITGQPDWQVAGTVAGNVSSYNLMGLEPATGYQVRVCVACNAIDEEVCTESSFVTATPEALDCGPLPNPTTFAITNSNIRVIWENITQASGYTLNWRKIPNPGDPVEAQEAQVGLATDGNSSSTAPSNNPGTSAPPPNTLILPAGSTEGTATGLAAGWNYAFKLCKDCPDGTQECVEWVEVFNGAVDYCSDDYAPYLTVVYGSQTQTTLDLGWTFTSAQSLPQGYSQIVTYFPTTVLGTTDTVTLSNSQLSTTLENLDVETEYTAKICVLCPDGNKLCSTVNGTTLPYACPEELELESGVVVTPIVPDGIKVDWTLFGLSTTTEGWSFALLNMAGDTLQKATAEVGYTHTFMGLAPETEYRVAYCHECEDGTKNCAEETIYLAGCDAAELNLEPGMIHFDFVELEWKDAGAEKYTVTFTEQGSTTSIGDPQTTEETDFRLGGLSPLTSYEISICFECGVMPVCDTIVVTTIGVNCALAGDYEYDFECGLNVSLQDPENQQLVETLNPGDSIWAGDFLVEIAEITGNTTFGGFGHTKIPYLAGAKLQLDFHAIQVNEDCRMVAGKMVVKSPLEAALEQLQQGLLDLQDILGSIDDFLGSLSATLGSISSVLDQIATAADVTDEANAVLEQLVIALDQVPYLPDSYVDAVEDAADCLKLAALSGDDAAVRACRDQLQQAIEDAQNFIDDLFDADFIVDFAPTVPANIYWGLDSQRYDLITESYDQRTIGGTPYKVPWASTSTEQASGVPFGAVRRDGETMNPVNFIGSDTQPYPGWSKNGTSASNPGLYADGDQQVKVVFAAHDNPEAEEGNDSIPPVKLAGQLNVITYTPVRHTVHIIPVNGAALTQDASSVELAVNRIFRPSVAEWTVSIEPELSVPEFDGQLSDIPQSLLSNYTPEMNLLKGKVKDQGYYDGDHYYLIVVPSMQEPGRLGFMPRKRSFGFLSAAQLTDAGTFNRTVAHELAHGAFHLQHVFDRFDGLSPGATDNLMDSGGGEKLYKYQWDNVHDPESNFTLFDEEEEGEYVDLGESFILEILLANSVDSLLTFLNTTGDKVTLDGRELTTLRFATGGERYEGTETFLPVGSLVAFGIKKPSGGTDIYSNCQSTSADYFLQQIEEGATEDYLVNPECSTAATEEIILPTQSVDGKIILIRPVWSSGGYALNVVKSDSYFGTTTTPSYDSYVRYFFSQELEALSLSSAAFGEVIPSSQEGGDDFTLSGEFYAETFLTYLDRYKDYAEFDDMSSFYLFASALTFYDYAVYSEACSTEDDALASLLSLINLKAFSETSGLIDHLGTPANYGAEILFDEGMSDLREYYLSQIDDYEEAQAFNIVSAVFNRAGRIAFFQEQIDAINQTDPDVGDFTELASTVSSELSECELEQLTIPYVIIEPLFREFFAPPVPLLQRPFWNENAYERMLLLLMRKIPEENYQEFIRVLRDEKENFFAGNEYIWKELIDRVDNSWIDRNGHDLMVEITKMCKHLYTTPGSDYYNEVASLTSLLEAYSPEGTNFSAVYDALELKLVPYHYTTILGRVALDFVQVSGIPLIADLGNFVFTGDAGEDWSAYIETELDIDSNDGTIDITYEVETSRIWGSLTTPEEFDALDPFEPIIIDPESTFRDARQFDPTGIKLVPASILYYLDNSATNQTANDVVIITTSALVLASGNPAGLATLSGQFAALGQLSAVSALGAQLADISQSENETANEIRDGLNLLSGATGAVSFVGSGILSLSNLSKAGRTAQMVSLIDGGTANLDTRISRFNTAVDGVSDLSPAALLKLAEGNLTRLEDLLAIIHRGKNILIGSGASLDDLNIAGITNFTQRVHYLVKISNTPASPLLISQFAELAASKQLIFLQDFITASPATWNGLNGVQGVVPTWLGLQSAGVLTLRTSTTWLTRITQWTTDGIEVGYSPIGEDVAIFSSFDGIQIANFSINAGEDILEIMADGILPIIAPSEGSIVASSLITIPIKTPCGEVISGGYIAKTSSGSVGFIDDVSSYNNEILRHALSHRGELRTALKNVGLVGVDEQAHHLIPYEHLQYNEVVQDAVIAGFDFNGTTNGIGLRSVGNPPIHKGSHGAYNTLILSKIDDWYQIASNNGTYSPAAARTYLESLCMTIRAEIAISPNTPINQITF